MDQAPLIQFEPTGPCPSPLMLVGEAPGEKEVQFRKPFVGASGWELDKMLIEAGLHRSQFFLTNVCRERPPSNDIEAFIASTVRQRSAEPSRFQEISGKWVDSRIRYGRELLHREIGLVRPTLIIAFGNLALWALCGHWGIRKWRGSVLQGEVDGHKFKVLPTLHPAAVLREWSMRRVVVHDLLRAAAEVRDGPLVASPEYKFQVAPTFTEARETLEGILQQLSETNTPLKLAADKETRAGHIACLGIAWSRLEAICIPFMCVARPDGYWPIEEEAYLIHLLQRILTHSKAEVVWQNGSYDQQYAYRRHLYVPRLDRDTLLTQHAMFSVSQKSLDFLSSLYCAHHVYWKDDGKKWDPSIDERSYWRYNCTDCVRTYEIDEKQLETIESFRPSWPQLPGIVQFQSQLQNAVMRMMLRGVRSDEAARAEMRAQLGKRIEELEKEIADIAGQELNPASSKQMQDFFYQQLNLTPVMKRTPTGLRPTCDDDALEKIAGREPILRPLIARIHGLRSARVFKSTFVEMRRDEDGRIRCSFNVGGTVTYRFSSSENAFDSGGNLQNISSGESDGEWWGEIVELPNIKKLFLPDRDQTWFDLDGDSADLRVVTGESDCKQMQAYFAAGVKPYVEVAKEFYRDPTITKAHPRYRTMKALCHATNYLGTPEGLSARIGLPVFDVERMQRWYFGMCPEIRVWQEELKNQVVKRGYIENPFGYRCFFWDRISNKTFNEAVAWVPQSTVALWINKILYAIDQGYEAGEHLIEVLLQVHDSLDGQFPTIMKEVCTALLKKTAAGVVIPCRSGPLVIPAGVKTSERSWGECA